MGRLCGSAQIARATWLYNRIESLYRRIYKPLVSILSNNLLEHLLVLGSIERQSPLTSRNGW